MKLEKKTLNVPDITNMVALLFTQAAAKEGNVRSLLLNETRAFVLNGISSGAFAGKKPSGTAAQGLLAPLFADASTGRKEIKSVGQARRDGDGWLVPFVVHDGGNGESYDVTGRVTPVNGEMRLTSVANMPFWPSMSANWARGAQGRLCACRSVQAELPRIFLPVARPFAVVLCRFVGKCATGRLAAALQCGLACDKPAVTQRPCRCWLPSAPLRVA